MATREGTFRVKHSLVGNFTEGSVITADMLGKDIDIDRLVNLGAIEPTDKSVDVKGTIQAPGEPPPVLSTASPAPATAPVTAPATAPTTYPEGGERPTVPIAKKR